MSQINSTALLLTRAARALRPLAMRAPEALHPPMPTRLRKALGVAALLTYLALYIALIAVLADRFIMAAPWWGQLAFFAAAGIVWIAPLKPLFGWMNGGS